MIGSVLQCQGIARELNHHTTTVISDLTFLKLIQNPHTHALIP